MGKAKSVWLRNPFVTGVYLGAGLTAWHCIWILGVTTVLTLRDGWVDLYTFAQNYLHLFLKGLMV